MNTAFRPMVSENHAHRNLPEPLAIEMNPTSPAAVAAVTWEISWAIGDACEMMAIPAVVFKNSVSHSAYHCQVPSACRSVKSRGAAGLRRRFCPGSPGAYPSGGFLITAAANKMIAKYAI